MNDRSLTRVFATEQKTGEAASSQCAKLRYCLLFVGARHCKFCDQMKEALIQHSAAQWGSRLLFLSPISSTAELEEVVKRYNIKEFPALLLFENGVLARRWIGYFDDEPLVEKSTKIYFFLRGLYDEMSAKYA